MMSSSGLTDSIPNNLEGKVEEARKVNDQPIALRAEEMFY